MAVNESIVSHSSEGNLLDYLYVAARGWKLILFNSLAICGVAAIVSLFLPTWYSGVTTILPPTRSEGGMFAEMLENIPALRLGQRATPADIIKAMLKSERVLRAVVEECDLADVYGINAHGGDPNKRTALAVEKLADLSNPTITAEGLIRLSVLDRDRQRCARIANALVDTLISLKQELDAEDDARTAAFLGQALLDTEAKLRAAQTDLQVFLEEHGVASVSDQATAVIQAAATLEVEVINLQMSLEYLRTSLGETHPQVKEIETKIGLRQHQLESLETGDWSGESRSLFPALRNVPQLTLEQQRLQAQLGIWSNVLGYLLGKRAEAEFRRDNPSTGIQVLDRATSPVRKTKPRRTLIVVIAGSASLLISLFAVVVTRSYESMRQSSHENAQKLEKVLDQFRRRSREP